MTDAFDNQTVHMHGHDIDSGSMPMSVGNDTKHVMPLFLQRKNGIPEVTNWDDSINSVSKTDKAYFVDQQASNCGQPKDIVIKDDICVVGYPHHTATIKSEISLNAPLHQTYFRIENQLYVCYNEETISDIDPDVEHVALGGSILDYTLNTPEIEDVPGGDEEDHTYFYESYLKLTTGGNTEYYPFVDFITSLDYVAATSVNGGIVETCAWGQDGQPLSFGWYYLTDLNKIAISGRPFSPTIPTDLAIYSLPGRLEYRRNVVFNNRSGSTGCVQCGDSEVCEECVGQSAFYSYSENVEVSLIKLTHFEDCGKIDVYHKKSGKIEAYNNNEITSTDHDLSDYDILKISGEFGEGNTVSDINGVVYVKVVDSNTFTIFSDPRTDEAGSVEDFSIDPGTIDNLTSLEWTCIGNSEQDSYQSWNYYGSYGSPTGLNGYAVTLPISDYGGNYSNETLNSVALWDAAVPVTAGLSELNFKSSSDYPAKMYFGYSLDIMKIRTGTEEFHALSVGEPGSPVTYARLGADTKREQLVPSYPTSGRVQLFRIDTDTNRQVSGIGSDGYISAEDQPWANVHAAIDNLLINPSNILSLIDIADAAVSEQYWLDISTNPNPSGNSRSCVWSDLFGRGTGNGHQHDLTQNTTSKDFFSTAISSKYRMQIYNTEVDTTGSASFSIANTVLSQEIYTDPIVSMLSGIEYNYEVLCFGREDGILVFEYSNPTDVTDDNFTQMDRIETPADITIQETDLWGRNYGQYISQYGEYLLTNGVSLTNEFGNESLNAVDYVLLYKRQVGNAYKQLQRIAPCIAKSDDFYSGLTASDLIAMGLVKNGNMSYSGKSEGTYTWTDLNMTGAYDIHKNKIIYRDRLEYVVFKDNWNTKIKNPLSGQVAPENYFFFRERYDSDNIGTAQNPYIDYNYDSNFDGSISVVESYYRHDTLILFFDIPRFQGYINIYDSLNVSLSIERNDNQDDAPMLVFYDSDPRDTISSRYVLPITDGACDGGTPYDLGTYNGGNFTLEDNGSYSVNVDIPASIFLDGLVEGKLTDSSDELEDSYTDTGNVNKTLVMGIKVRRRRSGAVDCYTEDGDRLNSGNFYESTSKIQDATLRLSYSLYEEKSLRRFDLASRKIAVPDISETDDINTILEAFPSEINQIRIGESLSSAYIDESESNIKKGGSSRSLQVFESSLGGFSSDVSVSLSDYKILYNEALNSRTYKEKATHASFDIHRPEFLSLYISSNLVGTGNRPLFAQGHTPETGGNTLYAAGIAADNSNLPLYIGPLTENRSLDLSIPQTKGLKNNSLPLIGPRLKGYDAPPTGINLYMEAPDIDGDSELYIKAPIPDTGNINLHTFGPIKDTGNMPLYLDGHRGFNTPVGRPPLYMAGMIPDTGSVPLHIGRKQETGVFPLSMSGPIPTSNSIPLYMLSPYNESLNLSMPQTKGGATQGATLVMYDFREEKALDISMSGPIPDNSETTLFTKYSPTDVNNIDDNPHNPCKLTGPDYRFDKTSNSENLVSNHNSITNLEELSGVGFNEIEDNNGLTLLGENIKSAASDSSISDLFYSQDRINRAYTSNGSIFVVGENTSIQNAPENKNGLIIYDVSNGSLLNKRVLNLLPEIDANIYIPTSKTTYKDIVVSDSGKIAFSIHVNFTNGFAQLGREYLVVLNSDFSVNTVVTSEHATGGETYLKSDKRIADSIVWDGEDLYHSEQTPTFGRVVRRDSSDYGTKTIVAEFEDTTDFANYESNLIYNEYLKAGFGHRIVLTNDKLIVSAPLLDPYMANNTITSYTQYSPRGAVYIFNRSGDTFTYSEAVYAGGLTSSTITPTSFVATTTSFDVRYFGYSVDYSGISKKLLVGEPGHGNTSTNGGYGRAHTYNLVDTASLVRTSSPTIVEENSLFGIFVGLCDHYTEFVMSRESTGKIYNINTDAEYVFDSTLTDDEVDQYIPDLQTLTNTSQEAQVMKIVNLGTDKMIIGRKFDYTYGFTSDTLFKLTVLNAGKSSNFDLFIKTIESYDGEVPLVIKPSHPGYMTLTLPVLGENNTLEMTLKAPEAYSDGMTLDMTNTDSHNMTTFIEGLFEETTTERTLFIKTVETSSNSMNLVYAYPYDPLYRLNLSIRAADPHQQWASSSLFIDEGTVTRTAVDLNSSINLQTLGDNGIKNIQRGLSINIEGGGTGYVNARPTLYMEGQPSVAVDKYTSMFIHVDDPTGSSSDNLSLSLYNNEVSGTIMNSSSGNPLYIINSIPTNTNATLFLQRKGLGGGEELDSNKNLFIESPDQDSNIPLYTTSAFGDTGSKNLVIPQTVGAPSGNKPLMIRGYQE